MIPSSATRRRRHRAHVIAPVAFLVAVLAVAGACRSGSNDENGDHVTIDHVETDHFELDLREPPSRADIGMSEGSIGMSIYFKDDTSRTFRTDVVLPEAGSLSVEPRLISIDPTTNLERPRDLTTETAPPGQVTMQFHFDDADELGAFLTDLAGQLGDHAGGITPEYIADTVGRADDETGQPRIATTEIGFVSVSVQPRAGREDVVTPHLLLDLRWSAMPDDG